MIAMTLDDLKMNELRELGYLLENYVDREVRGTSLDGLRSEISDALLELDEDALHEVVERAAAQGLALDPADAESDDGDGDAAGDTGEDENEGADGPADNALIIQIRCHPREGGLYNGDLLQAPKQFIVDRYPHARLSVADAKSLHARGYRWNTDSRYSDKPNEHP